MQRKKDQLLQYFKELAEIPSPSRHERKVADKIKKIVHELGYVCTEDKAGEELGGDAGNLIIHVPASGKGTKLLLSAHIDTVERLSNPPAKAIVTDGNISREGGGIVGADDKSGVAVLLSLLAQLKSSKVKHGELLIALSVCEETECEGASVLSEDLYAGFDAGIVLDHSAPWEIVTAAPTKVSFRITMHGVGGHAAFPETRINAAHAMATAISRLPSGRLDEYSTCNIGIIHSGSAINIIPETAYAEYELRSHRKDILDFHVRKIISVIEGAVREHQIFLHKRGYGIGDDLNREQTRQATVDVELAVSYEGYLVSENAYPVQILKKAIADCGMTPKTVTAQGGSDANIFNCRGLPSVVLGCGLHGAHSAKEYANLDEMYKALEVLLKVVTADA